jgi:hypothetical protein
MNDDLISRAAAIDAIVKWAESHHENPDGDDCIMIILDVPPAHPEIIHCRDCKHHWTFRPYGDFPTETCELEQTFYDANVDFCSLAERRTDEGVDLPTGGD